MLNLLLRSKLFSQRRLLDENGSAAVEFCIVAPLLTLGLLATIDLGVAEYDRMALDSSLRISAQYAMTDPGETAVCERLSSLLSKNFMEGSNPCSSQNGTLTAQSSRFCACPDALDNAVDCFSSCNGQSTRVFYRITASKMQTFNILPIQSNNLTTTLTVQIR